MPAFLQEMQNAAARRKLVELDEISDRQGKAYMHGLLLSDEALCHRVLLRESCNTAASRYMAYMQITPDTVWFSKIIYVTHIYYIVVCYIY